MTDTVTTVQFERPPEISATQPFPVPINNTFKARFQAVWSSGGPIDLTDSKVYLTIKSALSDVDGSADYQKNSTDHSTIVVVASGTDGYYSIEVPADALTSALTADTNYYIDTEIITGGGDVLTHLYDIIRPFQQVTKSVS